MKKFINHVDHVVYLSKWETIEANVANLEAITGASMERAERHDLGCVIYIDWSAGLEMVAPLPSRSDLNKAVYERLETQGEGLLAVVYGVRDLEAYKAKLETKGFAVGPLMSGDPIEPWYNRIILRERFAPAVMNSWLVLGQIDYNDDVIRFEDVKETASVD